MKTAVLLYGHYRTFPQAIQSWKKFYTDYNVDIFIHGWNNVGAFTFKSQNPMDVSNTGTILDDDVSVTGYVFK